MIVTMQPTGEMVRIDGQVARRWMGITDEGTTVDVFVKMLRVNASEDSKSFERELQAVPAPYHDVIDLRMVI